MTNRIVSRVTGTLVAAVCLWVAVPAAAQQGTGGGEWRVHGGDIGFTRYSPLDQIDEQNVDELEIVWRRPAVGPELRAQYPDLRYGNNLRSTPIMVDGVLYASNGIGLVEAIDPGTGETIWVQELPGNAPEALRGAPVRTVGYWESGDDRRIMVVRAPYLMALEAGTGRIIRDFGDGGLVDLRYYECITPAGRRLSDCDLPNNITGPREFTNMSGPLVVGNAVVIGSSQNNHPRDREMDPGDVRAYDARTGHLLWTFRPIPSGGEEGVETWLDRSWQYSGKASAWTLMAADPELGLIYIPTASPTSDMFGGNRPGNNLFANSIVAVRADNGERVWHYQLVHHDLWDYDTNVPPILADITVDGQPIKALIQLGKQAMAYVFDRETGEPVWPIEERPVPQSRTPGEWTSPTQPFPTRPAPYDLHGMTEDDLIDFTPELRREALDIFRQYISGPIFTPPSPSGEMGQGNLGTLQMPGATGGAEWGGAPFDPETGILYVPSITAPLQADVAPVDSEEGNVGLSRGMRGLPVGPQGLPLTKPPYGRITAIDMNTGEHLWQVANGEGPKNHPAIAHLNLPDLGTTGRSMSLLTRTLLFVSEGDPLMVRTPPGTAPDDGRGFRAFDKQTGEVIWKTELPAGTNGSPITYMHEGKQYIVIPIGSAELPGEWVALALP